MPSTYPPGYPTWVDKFYFNDILRKDYGQFKIVRFNVAPLNAKGENYASLMYRVKMTVEQEGGLAHRNFVVKSRLVSEMPAGLEEALNVFPKEIQMYTEVLPQFVAMFKEAGEAVRFGPSCFVGTRHPSDLIIMEDLSLTGFRSADRMVGLDFEHVKLTVAKLAKLHAASAVLVEKVRRNFLIFGRILFYKFFSYSRETIPLRNSSTGCLRKICADSWKRCSIRVGIFRGRA